MVRGVALALSVVTGVTALVYQVAWQKYLAALLGSHSEATATVLGIFLGGLSFGYAFFGRLSLRRAERARKNGTPAHLVRTYGWVEAAIGVYALAFPWLFRAAMAVSVWAPRGSDTLSFAFDVVLTALLIGPPAVLMGGTIPLLTQALARGLRDATRLHAFVYAFNSAGAFLGALAGGFWLVPRLGLAGATSAMGLVNMGAGLAFLALDTRAGAAFTEDETQAPDDARRTDVGVYVTVATLSGFAMMALQTVLNRVGAFSLGSSPFTFAMIVAVFVLCIALGSFAVSVLPRIPRSLLALSQWGLAAYLLLLYPAVGNASYRAHLIRSLFRDSDNAFHAYHAAVFVALLLVLAVPLALSGATLPLLFHHLRRKTGSLGDVAGRIYSWNTVGSLLGALIGGYLLLFWLDLHQIYRLIVLAVAATAVLLSLHTLARGRIVAAAGGVVVLGAVLLLPAWSPARLSSGAFSVRGPTSQTGAGPDAFFERYLGPSVGVPFYEDGPVASVAVRELRLRGGGINHAVFINGKNDSSIPGDRLTTGLLALLPAILADKNERAFVIGYGTGKTAGELGALESMREVVVAEIARGVIRAAPHFEPYNQHASTNGKTRLIRSDAYRALLRSSGGFDVITSEPSNPWVAGVELLYSLEFLQAARERLAPGGVFTQWIHVYDISDETLELVLNTYRSAFDRVAVWYGKSNDLLLVGFEAAEAKIDLDRLARRWSREDFRAAFARSGIDSLPALIAHELLPLGVLEHADLGGRVHTILRPVLNFEAARDYFVGINATLPPTSDSAAAAAGARNSLVRRFRARFGADYPDAFRGRVVEETCAHRSRACAALFAEWRREAPDSPALAASLDRMRRGSAAGELDTATLSRLQTLFAPEGTADLPGEYAYVSRIYETFDRYYEHAAPFDARALHGPLERCAEPACRELSPVALGKGVALPVTPEP